MTLLLDCNAEVSGLLEPHQHPSIICFMKSVEPRGFLEGVCSIRDKSSGLSGLTQHQLHKFMSESIHSVVTVVICFAESRFVAISQVSLISYHEGLIEATPGFEEVRCFVDRNQEWELWLVGI